MTLLKWINFSGTCDELDKVWSKMQSIKNVRITNSTYLSWKNWNNINMQEIGKGPKLNKALPPHWYNSRNK